MKRNKILALMAMLTIVVMAVPVSAHFPAQTEETRAELMVQIADGARNKVLELAALVESDSEAMEQIVNAGLDDEFYSNVSLCVEAGTSVGGEAATEDGLGWTYLEAANQSLQAGEYEEAIEQAKEALKVFREALMSIHVIVHEAEVELREIVAPEVLSDAIARSLNRTAELRELLADEEMLAKLNEAEDLLNEAQELLATGDIEAVKENLREANVLISQVCLHLKRVAEELNPFRFKRFIDGMWRYRERFRERFGHAWSENFDVNGFLQKFGFPGEDYFMNKFQELIEKAQGEQNFEDAIQDLQELGQTVRLMDRAFTVEFGRFRAQHGFGQGNGMMGPWGNH